MANSWLEGGTRRLARELTAAAFDLLLPPHCAACGEPVVSGRLRLCAGCHRLLDRRVSGCERCGEVLAPGGDCLADHRQLQGLAWLRAPLRYAGTGGALVRRLKLGGDFAALPLLAAAMARVLRPRLVGPWRRALLVPVPLHRRRRRVRGFDQAEVLAAAVAARVGLPAPARLLRRTRLTLPQGDPRVLSRERNLEAAFAAAPSRRLVRASVVLVDDVFTSGATARQCARELVAAGAARVGVLVACRS